MRWGRRPSPVERSWEHKDALLYALGVGAGATDPTGFELEFTTENSDGVTQRVLPTFTTIIGQGGGARTSARRLRPGHARPRGAVDPPARRDPGGGVRVDHDDGGRHVRQGRRPVWWCSRASRVSPTAASLPSRAVRRLFIRGDGWLGWPAEPRGRRRRARWPPSRCRPVSPTRRSPIATRPDQALLYRLSGDRNPLHSDPTFAKRGGLRHADPARPVHLRLHRARPAALWCAGSDPARFGAMRARFSKPTMPGDTLTVSVWDIGDDGRGASTASAPRHSGARP